MASSNGTNTIPALQIPVFNGENYHIWSVKMKAYLKAFGIWDVVEGTARAVPELPENPTIQQLEDREQAVAKGFKALSILHSTVTDVIFTRIIACETAKEAWDKLQQECQGSDRTRRMEVISLRRYFEALRMKESETIKEYWDRVMMIVNKMRLLGEEVSEKRIVEKIILTLPERFESKIFSLSEIPLPELMNALQVEEEKLSEGGFKGILTYQACTHCKKTSHLERYFP